MKNYKSFLNEVLNAKEFDSKSFKNSGTKSGDKGFFINGKKDGDFNDDVVRTSYYSLPAIQLKPSQNTIYLGKALSLSIKNLVGGNLKALISKDNYIVDGHHRWASTMFSKPNAKIGGMQSELRIGDLIIVLREIGDELGNRRGTEPDGGDMSIFDATIEDVEDCIYRGKNMDVKFYNRDSAIAWYENLGRDLVEKRLKLIQSKKIKSGALPREEMPRIKPDQVDLVTNYLNSGKIDIRKPFYKK